MVAAPVNQSIKFVPAGGLHRTPLSGRRLFQRYENSTKTIFAAPSIRLVVGADHPLVHAPGAIHFEVALICKQLQKPFSQINNNDGE